MIPLDFHNELPVGDCSCACTMVRPDKGNSTPLVSSDGAFEHQHSLTLSRKRSTTLGVVFDILYDDMVFSGIGSETEVAVHHKTVLCF